MNIDEFQSLLAANNPKYYMNERLNKLSGYTALLRLGMFHTSELSQVSKEEAERLLALSLVELFSFASECNINVSLLLSNFLLYWRNNADAN